MIIKFNTQVPPGSCYFASLYPVDKRKNKINDHQNLQTRLDLSKTLIMSGLQRLLTAAVLDAGILSPSVPVRCWVILCLNYFAINNEQQQHPKGELKCQFAHQREKDYPKRW